MDAGLLATKLRPPPPTPDLLPRPRLNERLNERAQRGLTLISTPAGYGKTTLLSAWCEAVDLPIAWVSLNENDNFSNLFMRYLVAALGAHHPNSFIELGALLATSQEIPIQVLVTSFVNQIDEWRERVILVLDDYHVIKEGPPSEFFSILVQNLPPNLHLVLATRTDPVLPLARARAQGNLVELRTTDLRFTAQEVEAFLQHTVDKDIDPAMAALVDKRVEGWAAGLRLASLSIHGQDDLANLDSRIRSGGRWTTEYLVDQVLTKQSSETQDFLLRTALVDRFSLPLAEVLLEGTVSHPKLVLEAIQRANLFLIPLDDEQVWFRYHHLFQELLRERLNRQFGNSKVAELHQRASEWFSENGLIDEALQHALKGGDLTSAARMIESNSPTYFNREDWRTVQHWLEQLPAEVFERHLLLQVVRAWTWFIQWKLEALPPFVQRMESFFEQSTLKVDATTESLVRGYLYVLQALFAYYRADAEQCIQYSRQALELAPSHYRFLRGWAYYFQSTGLAYLGNQTEAIDLLNISLEQDGFQADEFTARLLMAKMYLFFLNNELHRCLETSEQYLNLALRANLLESAVWAHNGCGRVYYEWNDLDLALRHFAQAVELRYTANARGTHSSHVGLALTYQTLGFTEQANQVAASAREIALETQLPTLPYVSTALEARLAMMQDDVETAVRRAGTLSLQVTPNLYGFVEVPDLTKLHILIAEGTPASLEAAEEFYRAIYEFCERIHSKYYMTNVLALGSLLLAAQGREAEALETLRKAVESARGGQRLRVFADLGKPMRVLLRKLLSGEPGDKYLRQILAAFKPDEASGIRGPQEKGDSPMPRMPSLVNPLTQRELEILALLGTRLSIKEIADKLVISPLTVTKHTQHIYSKLGVNNRLLAVATARQLSVLTP